MTKAYAYARMLGKLTRHSLLNRMIRVGKTHRLRARTARALDICNLRWCPHANAFHIRRQHPAPTSSRWGTIRNPTWWSRRSGPARRRPCRCRARWSILQAVQRPPGATAGAADCPSGRRNTEAVHPVNMVLWSPGFGAATGAGPAVPARSGAGTQRTIREDGLFRKGRGRAGRCATRVTQRSPGRR